ncbi:MAG: tRNA adenosine(34) deaminase TadA [Endomicrobium sp.]|uniref:tRNA adenosine(34) deaminase TadA n=1 Tax=Candidatus Endomicrobiellum cubanum TaxID=3242325 RepID=UPI002817A5D0|nr:tRNA adenosine(34) deaminase TadA [Endomicrobium sp.]
MKNKVTAVNSYFMSQALKEAYKAYKSDEVPVGAVIVKNGEIISRGFNRCISLLDPTAHAEIVALRKAAKKMQNYRLNDCCIYVTIEPCAMCTGALVNARVKKIVFGAFDIKAGACKSVFKIANNKKLNHQIEIFGGKEEYLSLECAEFLHSFFKAKRSNIQIHK